MGMNFLSSRNSIVLLRILLKILKFGFSNLFIRNVISTCGNLFFGQQKLIFSIFKILVLLKGIFCLAKTYFSTNFSFRLVETDFLPCGNRFLLFNHFFLQGKTFTENSGIKFIWERLCSGRKGFSIQWKLFPFILYFFPTSGNSY